MRTNTGIDENYPLTVVGYGDDTWQVRNLLTGENLACKIDCCAKAHRFMDFCTTYEIYNDYKANLLWGKFLDLDANIDEILESEAYQRLQEETLEDLISEYRTVTYLKGCP